MTTSNPPGLPESFLAPRYQIYGLRGRLPCIVTTSVDAYPCFQSDADKPTWVSQDERGPYPLSENLDAT